MGLLNRAENGAQTQFSQTMQQVATRGDHCRYLGTRDFFGRNAANIEVIDSRGAVPKSVTSTQASAQARPRLAVQERSAQSVSSYGATASVRAPHQTTPDVKLTTARTLELMGIQVVSVIPNKKVVIQFNGKEVTVLRHSATGVGVDLPPKSARLFRDTLAQNNVSLLDLVNELTINDVSRIAKPKSSWLGGIFRW